MEVTYEITPEDYWQYNLYYRRKNSKLRPFFRNLLIGVALTVALTSVAVSGLTWQKTSEVPWPSLVYLGVVLWFGLKYFPLTKSRAYKLAAKSSNLIGEHTILIDPQWDCEKTATSENKRAWTTVFSVEQDQYYLFIFLIKNVAHIIPKRAFSSLHEAESFLTAARYYWDIAKQNHQFQAQEVEGAWPPAPRPGA